MLLCFCLGLFNGNNKEMSCVTLSESGFGIEFMWFLHNENFVNYLLFEG